MVDAFLAAARNGDFDALLAVLDPDVVVRADQGAGPAGAPRVVRGAAAVARSALGYARLGMLTQPALVNGVAGAVTTRDGVAFSVGAFTVRGGKVVALDILADPDRLRDLDLTDPRLSGHAPSASRYCRARAKAAAASGTPAVTRPCHPCTMPGHDSAVTATPASMAAAASASVPRRSVSYCPAGR